MRWGVRWFMFVNYGAIALAYAAFFIAKAPKSSHPSA
jgi:hypothetical protein